MTNTLQLSIDFARSFNAMSQAVHALACEKGWWQQERSIIGLLGLVASECVGEGIEAIRKPGPSDKISDYLNIEEELSDTLIRLADMAAHLEIDLGSWVAFEYSNGMGISEFQSMVYDDTGDFADFTKHYNLFTDAIDLWPYVTDDFRAQVTRKIDDLDMLTGLIPKLARCIDSSGRHGEDGSLMFTVDMRLLTLRIMAMGQHRGWRIAEAIVAKHAYNMGRSERHGGKVY